MRRVVWSLNRPLTTGAEGSVRRVLHIRLDHAGRLALGEASPLPGLHEESLAEVEKQVAGLASRWKEGRPEESPLELARRLGLDLPPSLAWALETAWRDLGDEAPRPTAPPSAGLLDAPPAHWINELESRPMRPAWKVKVGRHDLREEAAGLRALMRRHPRVEWRLDANRSLDLATALAFQRAAGAFIPAWIEEPLADPRQLPDWLRAGGWPFALDESLQDDLPMELLEAAAAWVLKPAWLGPRLVEEWFGRSRRRTAAGGRGPLCVVSSCFETPLGLEALARLAADAPGRPHPGLGTDEWLGACLEEEPWTTLA
jgi:o-succinylbenzoate synthase